MIYENENGADGIVNILRALHMYPKVGMVKSDSIESRALLEASLECSKQ